MWYSKQVWDKRKANASCSLLGDPRSGRSYKSKRPSADKRFDKLALQRSLPMPRSLQTRSFVSVVTCASQHHSAAHHAFKTNPYSEQAAKPKPLVNIRDFQTGTVIRFCVCLASERHVASEHEPNTISGHEPPQGLASADVVKPPPTTQSSFVIRV